MKKYLSFLLFIFLSTSIFAQSNDIPIGNNNISEDIYDALSLCYEEFSESPLQSIYEILEDHYVKNADRKFKYWQAYIKMYTYIYTKDTLDIENSIHIMNTLKVNTSEELAFLAFLKSFKMSSVKDKNKLKIISSEARELANKALNMNKNNLRAYYVLAALEYYNPKYDRKKLKKYLDNALKINEKPKNYYDIVWGKNLIYELYIKYYLKNKKIKKAKKIYNKAIIEFPNDYLIKKYYEFNRK